MAEHIPFHATIVAGPEAAGLERARTLAMTLVCTGEQPPCGVCRDCQKVQKDIHPDVISIENFMEKGASDMIKIDAVRALRKDAFIKPNEAARKVYLIPRADTMNPNAQNVLLKLLEEGPSYAAFLLITERPGALLETIRSRCVQVSVQGSESETAIDENARGYAALLATGSELDRTAFLAKLELAKLDDSGMRSFLSGVERLAQDAVTGGVTGTFGWQESEALAQSMTRGDLLAAAERMRKAQEMIPFHVGKGHLLGWLGAGQQANAKR